MKYYDSEKFRAEIFRALAFGFSAPFGALFTHDLIFGFQLNWETVVGYSFALLCLAASHFLFGFSYHIMERISTMKWDHGKHTTKEDL